MRWATLVKREFRDTVGRLKHILLLVKNTETITFAIKMEGLSECEGKKPNSMKTEAYSLSISHGEGKAHTIVGWRGGGREEELD